MKLLKGFLLVFAGLFVMITLLSLLIPSNVITSKSVTINAPQQKIIAAIKSLQQWEKWHPVFANDASNHVISQPSPGAASSISWGENENKNSITLTEQLPQGVKFTLDRPGENTILNTILLLPLEDSTSYQVEWKALTHSKWYPWEKFAGIFVSQITGPGYEKALQSLKSYVEELP